MHFTQNIYGTYRVAELVEHSKSLEGIAIKCVKAGSGDGEQLPTIVNFVRPAIDGEPDTITLGKPLVDRRHVSGYVHARLDDSIQVFGQRTLIDCS